MQSAVACFFLLDAGLTIAHEPGKFQRLFHFCVARRARVIKLKPGIIVVGEQSLGKVDGVICWAIVFCCGWRTDFRRSVNGLRGTGGIIGLLV